MAPSKRGYQATQAASTALIPMGIRSQPPLPLILLLMSSPWDWSDHKFGHQMPAGQSPPLIQTGQWPPEVRSQMAPLAISMGLPKLGHKYGFLILAQMRSLLLLLLQVVQHLPQE